MVTLVYGPLDGGPWNLNVVVSVRGHASPRRHRGRRRGKAWPTPNVYVIATRCTAQPVVKD